ncbi:MAG: hypothetical protein JW832_16490 [Deltaproteobacteria bacterium]|nr:hypothetical protein [Deltaproteobacteria bacterium]
MKRIFFDRLVACIQNSSEAIVRQWIDHLKSDPTTATFAESDLKRFEIRALELLVNLDEWINYDKDKTDVGRRYAQEGIGLFKMGIPLCEGIRGLILLKRTIWLYLMYEMPLDTVIELNELRELNDRMSLFFDRAEYYFMRGFMEEMSRKMQQIWKLSDDDTDKVFFGRSFYKRNQMAA